jgi:hypothetical protein
MSHHPDQLEALEHGRSRTEARGFPPGLRIAAGIIGFIRQAALGDPLVPYEARGDRALRKILASRAWTTPQRQLQHVLDECNDSIWSPAA